MIIVGGVPRNKPWFLNRIVTLDTQNCNLIVEVLVELTQSALNVFWRRRIPPCSRKLTSREWLCTICLWPQNQQKVNLVIWGNSQEHKLCHSSNWFCFSTFDNHHSSVLDWSFKVDNYLFWPFCKKYLFYSSITPPDCHKNQSYKNYRGCNKCQKWLQNRSSRHPQASIHHLNRFIAVFLFRATTIAWTEF